MLLEPCRNPGSPNSGFPGCFKIGVPVIPEPWHNPGSGCSKPENLGIPESWRPGTQKLARTHYSRNLAQTLVRGTLGSRNLAPNPGSRNPGFPEPWFPKPAKRGGPWFAEPWVPGTLPRTLVPGTLVPGTGETKRQGRAVPRITPKAMWAETPKHSAVGEKTHKWKSKTVKPSRGSHQLLCQKILHKLECRIGCQVSSLPIWLSGKLDGFPELVWKIYKTISSFTCGRALPWDFFPTDGCHRTKVGFVRCASLKNNARIRGWISGYTNPVDSRLILQQGDVGVVHIIQFA